MKDYTKYIKVADAVKVLFEDCIRYVFPTTAEPTTEFIKLDNAINLLQLYPSADVVEVVRCKDCKWWDECDELDENGYCHHGERKDDE